MKLLSKKNLNYLIYMVSVILLIFIAFNTYITFQIHDQLAKMTSKPARWPVGAYIYDSKIGFDFAPDVSGPIQDGSFYVKSHHLAYRIGEYDDGNSFQARGVLSLGCSLTYGDEVESGQTFTQIVADSLNLPAYNYGICSFSYIHALQKAQNLKDEGVLDKLQPKYVILGCWKGLLNRSRTPFPPIAAKNIPLTAASIYKDKGELGIRYPLSSRHVFDLVTMYRKDGPELSFKKFMKIFTSVPGFAYIYIKNNQLYQTMRELKPEAQVSDYDVYDFYFSGIEKLFPSPATQIVVLFMPVAANDHPDAALMKALSQHPGILFVNGLEAVKKQDIPLKDYKGKHPQPAAHMAYARETIDLIESSPAD